VKPIVITGVSSGIGRAAAQLLVQRGHRVFGSVRRPEDARRLRLELGERFTPLLFDVTDRKAIDEAASEVQRQVAPGNIAALVNNAGYVCVGPLARVPVDQVRGQLEVNVLGPLQVTQAFLPVLGMRPEAPRPRGRIVNIGSVSGRIAYPFMGPYAASKHAVEALSDALRRELLMYGIDVVVIEPGTVKTPIIEKTTKQLDAYRDTEYGSALALLQQAEVRERLLGAMPVERVARLIVKAVEHPSPRARYPIPGSWLAGWVLPRLLPARLIDRVVAGRLGLTPAP
jgi:NAD(P)-dependent dehydrogenase (short-subunit alcohol dehydrogenase family)